MVRIGGGGSLHREILSAMIIPVLGGCLGEGTSGARVTMETEFRRPDRESPEPCESPGELERRLNRLILEELRV